LTEDLPSFTIQLKSGDIEDLYRFEITATAEGGYTTTVDSSMEIYDACFSTFKNF
jgi:hypothetical protein